MQEAPRNKGEIALYQDTALRDLVDTLATHHPHHALLPIFALANADQVGSATHGRDRFLRNFDDGKRQAALRVLERLRTGALSDQVDAYEQLTTAYIRLAEMDIRKYLNRRENREKGVPMKAYYEDRTPEQRKKDAAATVRMIGPLVFMIVTGGMDKDLRSIRVWELQAAAGAAAPAGA